MPKRFAPYPVWSRARAAAVLAGLLIAAGVLLPIVMGSLWPLLLLIPGFAIAPLLPGTMENGFTALTPELIGHALGSQYCPACGQSIFDDGGATGYMSDTDRTRWWPNRHCANCGHDLNQRLAA